VTSEFLIRQKHIMLLLLYILLLATYAAAQSSGCTLSSTGYSWDLTPLNTGDDYTISDDSGFWKFVWNYCALTSQEECFTDTAAWFSVYGGDCQILGDLGTQKMSPIDTNDPAKGVSLAYTTLDWCGDLYVGVVIDHVCDPAIPVLKTVQVVPFEGGSCTTRITVRSIHGCGTADGPTSPPSSGGIGWGWWFIIILLIVSTVYIIAGMGYRYRWQEARGLEMIPNRDFWSVLPGLVKDGCVYSYHTTRDIVSRFRGERSGYSNVSSQL